MCAACINHREIEGLDAEWWWLHSAGYGTGGVVDRICVDRVTVSWARGAHTVERESDRAREGGGSGGRTRKHSWWVMFGGWSV